MAETYSFSKPFANLAPSAIREILKSTGDPSMIAFAAGNPNAESFPYEDLARLSASIFSGDAARALQYGTTEGYTPLRQTVLERNKQKFGIGRDQDELMITSGGQQGLELACRVLCDPGDVVIAENPSFIGALNSFRAVGANLVGVPLDEDGMDLERLEKALQKHKNAKLIYVISNFQNPAGICTSLEKRKAIYALAKKYGVMILEDNPYGEIRFSGTDIPTIKSMDTDGIVVYCSSFSKLLSAGMRIGYVIAPAPVVAKMTVGKQCEDVHSNLFFQMLCHRYMTECDFDAHIARIRDIYRRKSSIMINAMETYFPESVTFTRPEGGLFIWCRLPEEIDMDIFVRSAMSRKVAVVPGSVFSPEPGAGVNAFRVTYATPTDEQLVEGVRRLGEIIG